MAPFLLLLVKKRKTLGKKLEIWSIIKVTENNINISHPHVYLILVLYNFANC